MAAPTIWPKATSFVRCRPNPATAASFRMSTASAPPPGPDTASMGVQVILSPNNYSKECLSNMTEQRFKGKIAIVTGAGQGIGKGVATRLAHEGASVVIAEYNAETASATAQEITES